MMSKKLSVAVVLLANALVLAVAGCLSEDDDAGATRSRQHSSAGLPAPSAASTASAAGNDASQAQVAAPAPRTANNHAPDAQAGDVDRAQTAAESPGGTPPAQGDAVTNAAGNYGRVSKKEPVDPIKANGPIFEGWSPPKLAIVISGEQNGYLEPCGCAGLENMKGGLGRRFSFLSELKRQGWPVVALDLGGLARRFGKQAELKYHISVDALRAMGYAAIGFGPGDLRLPVDELLADVSVDENSFVAANTAVLGFESPVTPRWRIIERAGYRLGVTAIIGEKYWQSVQNDIAYMPPEQALREVVPQLKQAQCDLLILLSHASVPESTELAKKFPEFDLVVTAGGAEIPPPDTVAIPGTRSRMIEIGHKGMYLGVIGLYGETTKEMRFQRVPVDARFADASEMKLRLAALQKQLAELGWSGLGSSEVPHARGQLFAGSEKCGECHTKAYAIWKKTPHAHATETLVQLDPPRQFDPECISCHATGWEPQKYFPFKGGYASLDSTPHLVGNGCENCHGPGARHAAVESGELEVDIQEQIALRRQMRLTLEAAKEHTCLQCHDLDNSPDYIKLGFEAYWPKVEHRGKN